MFDVEKCFALVMYPFDWDIEDAFDSFGGEDGGGLAKCDRTTSLEHEHTVCISAGLLQVVQDEKNSRATVGALTSDLEDLNLML